MKSLLLSCLILTGTLAAAASAARETAAQACRYEYFRTADTPDARSLPSRDGKLYGRITLAREYEPGWYRLTVPYRTEGDWEAQFAVYVEYSGQPRGQISSWQNVSAASQWTKLTVIVKLERRTAPVIVFNKNPSMGKLETLLVKTPELHPFPLSAATNWFIDDGCFQGADGALPVGWTHYHDMSPKRNGLTGEFGFERSDRVMRLGGTDDRPAQLQSTGFPFPPRGEMEFSVWAKSAGASAKIVMHLIGDGYQWSTSRRFQLSGNWQKYAIRLAVPEKYKKSPHFWCRIDIEKGQQALLGKVMLTNAVPTAGNRVATGFSPHPPLSRNLIANPGFELGSWGWDQWHYGPGKTPASIKALLERNEPELVSGGVGGGRALKVEPYTALTSFCFPLEYGKKYTASVWLKNAVPGQTAECGILVLDSNWKSRGKKFRLTDQWQRYSFSFDWNDHSRRGVAYLRFDPWQNPIMIDGAQVEAGNLTEFNAPPVQLGLVTADSQFCNIFNDADRKATMTLKAVCRPDVIGKIKIEAKVADAWGKNVLQREFTVDAAPVITLPLPVNASGRRGVFHATLTALDPQGKTIGRGESRYAVCRDLSGMKLPDNPYSGHFEMFRTVGIAVDRLMRLTGRYLPVNGFNRCFFSLTPEQFDNPQTVAEYRRLFQRWTWPARVKRIMVMGLSEQSGPWAEKLLREPQVEPEVMAAYLAFVKKQVTAFKGVVDGWELFNEPNLWRVKEGPDKGKPTMTPEKAAQLYKAAYPVIKAVDPAILVVGPCANGESFLPWSERFLKAGGAGHFDVFSFHGYSDSPDLFGMYGRIRQSQSMLTQYGMTGVPVWNTEQYYSARIPYLRQHENEYYRPYFRDRELDAAAALVSNLIHHAAAGSRLGMFAFYSNTVNGSEGELMINDFFAAANAAIEMLGTAGTGEQLELGSALKCFLFPRAEGGPLATVHGIDSEAAGRVTLPDGVRAYDLMGNPLSARTVAITNVPLYLRFPPGTAGTAAAEQLRNLRFLGLGDPFGLNLAMAGRDTLAVTVTNRLNRTAAGTLELREFPSGWKFDRNRAAFSNLQPGQHQVLTFRISGADLKPMTPYRFKFGVRTEHEFFTRAASLSAVFADFRPEIKGDGNLKSWKGASWITLGQENVSPRFNRLRDWKGPQDLSVKFACGWNRQGFGIALIVTDDRFLFPESPRQSWDRDSVQLYFDMKKDATAESAARKANLGDDVSYQIGFVNGRTPRAYLDKAPSGRYIGDANRDQGIDDAVRVSCRLLEPGRLFYDIFLPHETLPQIEFRPGSSFGFSLLVNDNDGQGRKTGLTLAPKGREPFGNPHEYRDLILLPQ